MNTTLLATFGSLLLAGSAASTILFVSGFESAEYTAGQPVSGQDNWVSLLSPDALLVVDDPANARSGRRSLQCWGGGPLTKVSLPFFDLLDGAWEQVVQFEPGAQPHKVRVSADVRLVGPDTGVGPNDDLLSANLYARNGANRSAFFFLSSNGNAYCFANSESHGSIGYAFETPIVQGEYNHLAITLDYETHLASFEVNGKVVGSLPFGGSGEAFHGVLMEFAAFDDLRFIDPKDYTGYWDNVAVLGTATNR